MRYIKTLKKLFTDISQKPTGSAFSGKKTGGKTRTQIRNGSTLKQNLQSGLETKLKSTKKQSVETVTDTKVDSKPPRSAASRRARSNKNKGREGQKEVQQLILAHFDELEHDDCRSNPMGSDGEDILLSPAARRVIPWNIEVKRKKKVGAARFMEQAGTHGDYLPVAFFREDRGNWYSVIEADYLFELVKTGKDQKARIKELEAKLKRTKK